MTTLKPGDRMTITPCRVTGDRSYTRGVHTVLAVNATHIQTSYHDDLFAPRQVMLVRADHSFTDAASFHTPSGTLPLRGEGTGPTLDEALAALWEPPTGSN